MKNEGEIFFPRFARTDGRYAPLCTPSGSVSYTVPPPFINPVSAPVVDIIILHNFILGGGGGGGGGEVNTNKWECGLFYAHLYTNKENIRS